MSPLPNRILSEAVPQDTAVAHALRDVSGDQVSKILGEHVSVWTLVSHRS